VSSRIGAGDVAVPRLAGLDRAAIAKAMQDFRSGQRPATVMDRIAKGFTDEEIQAIAAWYATQR
jgi:cytochrome c553